MLIESAFEVPNDVDEVWAALLDIERITPCLPGASIDENRGGGEYRGSMRIKLGPVTSTFEGTVAIREADEDAHRSVLEASARDTRGSGAASATITSRLEAGDEGTRVQVETDMKLSGTAAQFGGGVVTDVSRKMLDQFADRLAEEIRNPSQRVATTKPKPSSAPAEDVLDLGAVGRDAMLKRAGPLAGGAVGLVLLVLLLIRGSGRRRQPLVAIQGPLLILKTGAKRRRRRER